MKKEVQTEMLKKQKKAFGGELMKTREGRKGCRPLATRATMHLVLRSSKAKGEWSFKKSKNERKIEAILEKFSKKFGVMVLSMANVGNHLHLHIKLSNRYLYKPFIQATTAAIAMAVTGTSRWSKKKEQVGRAEQEQSESLESPEKQNPERQYPIKQNQSEAPARKRLHFWDYRPYTRVVQNFKAFLTLKDYIQINQFEGFGQSKLQARFHWGWTKASLQYAGTG
jgi:REP element-mobilizing transposase RayT